METMRLANTDGPALCVNGLTKAFKGNRVLDKVSFSVNDGEIVGLVGPNGAGKTTIMRIIVGLVHPDGGTAQVMGRPYSKWPVPRRAVGIVPERFGFHGSHTPMTLLTIIQASLGLNDASTADALLRQVGLSHAKNQRIKEFSLGMRQRLGVAVALSGQPRLLILDEPTNGLDPDGIFWLRDLLNAHAKSGGAVLISSHNLRELSAQADRCVMVDGGHVVGSPSRAEFEGEQSLEGYYQMKRSGQSEGVSL